MKKTTGARRVSVAQAKSQLSRLIREAAHSPVVIENRGREVATLTRGLPEQGERPFVAFLNRLEAVKRRLGVRGVEFEVPRAVIRPRNPFGDE